MPAHEFCTYFDQRYLTRGIALYRSLTRHCASFRLRVLCLDDKTYSVLNELKLPSVELISIGDFERANPDVAATRGNRSLLEYYFTCTPALVRQLLDDLLPGEQLTYLDADLWFFADSQPIFDEIGGASIGLLPSRYSSLEPGQGNGAYNVGWLMLRNDANGCAAATRWREQCIEWCYFRLEDGKYADQKYLDAWPDDYGGVHVIANRGAGVAPWNFTGRRFSSENGRATVDSELLLFYHFSHLRRVNGMIYDTLLPHFGVKPTRDLVQTIYKPYVEELAALQRETARFSLETKPLPQGPTRFERVPFGRQLQSLGRGLNQLALGVLRRGYVYMFRGRAYYP